MKKTYIVIHGLNGSKNNHWQNWLYKKLLHENNKVLFPQFSNDNNPILSNWLKELDTILKCAVGEKIIICHSLGVILWFHYIKNYQVHNIKNLLLVAPPGIKALNKIKEIKSFKNFNISESELKNSAEEIRFVSTEKDKYCIENAIEFYAKKLNLDYDILSPEKGHINEESGYGKWESVYKWCFDSSIRIKDQ